VAFEEINQINPARIKAWPVTLKNMHDAFLN